MPVVRVSFFEGRSADQKRKIAERITEAMAEIGGSRREGVHVIFEDVPRENWYIGAGAEAAASRSS